MYLAFKNQTSDLIAQLKDVNYLWVVLMFFGFIAITRLIKALDVAILIEKFKLQL